MSIATHWIAFGFRLCRNNSVANAYQTDASLPGVANSICIAFRSAITGRWLRPLRRFISSASTHTTLSKLNSSYAALIYAKRILHVRVSLLPKIWPAHFTGISRIRVTAEASNSRVKCLLRSSQGGVTR